MPTTSKVIVEQLLSTHDVTNFTCSFEPKLQAFLREGALEYHIKNVCTVYLVRNVTGELFGYFTLSPTAVYQESMSNTQAKKFPYNPISALLLGQFARDTIRSPKGFGSTLLREVLITSLTIPGWQIIAADPFSEESEEWFISLGFRQVKQNFPHTSADHPTKRLQLFMRRQDVEATVKALAD